MTANKRTPGPWEVAEKFNCVDVRGVDGPYIANCNQSVAIDWRTKEANARLIAAAPELLEALIRLEAELVEDKYSEEYEPSPFENLAVARAAIAKATGGAA